MNPHHMILFYVSNPKASADFYARLLGEGPLEASPGFAMFKLNDATMLGLWSKDGVEPRPDHPAGASELGFHVANDDEVNGLHARWKAEGTEIIQVPVKMDFGYTFTARDPDGHRLRVFAAA